jgi:hypothetical protein
MPVFLDHAGRDRDSRVESIRAAALPRLGPTQQSAANGEKYDVVVAGASLLCNGPDPRPMC